jgi:hypothetical protein
MAAALEPVDTWNRPSVYLSPIGPPGRAELDVLREQGRAVADVAERIGADPGRAEDRWPVSRGRESLGGQQCGWQQVRRSRVSAMTRSRLGPVRLVRVRCGPSQAASHSSSSPVSAARSGCYVCQTAMSSSDGYRGSVVTAGVDPSLRRPNPARRRRRNLAAAPVAL